MEAYPKVKETTRPFRLWNPHTNKQSPGRCYKYHRNATIGALIEVKWAKIGTVVEVIDVRHGTLIGQYKRTPTSVTFHKERNNVKD